MTDFLVRVAVETWYILKEALIFLLFGLALAGLLAVLVPARRLMRFVLEQPPPVATKAADECWDDTRAHHHRHRPPDRTSISPKAFAPASMAVFSTASGRALAVP
jgi:hypothetical protein